MYHTTTVIGIDPGIVDTGVVVFRFEPVLQRFYTTANVYHSAKAKEIAEGIRPLMAQPANRHVFVEAYRPRSNFSTDHRMTELQAELKAELLSAKFINNTGVKKVITAELMSALSVWHFQQRTNHQDLRSAARIALYGMVKDDELNEILADFISDYLNGKMWPHDTRI